MSPAAEGPPSPFDWPDGKVLSLADLSTIGLGGRALVLEARTLEELKALTALARGRGLRPVPVGGASNMLFPDQDLTVPVIRLSGDLREASVDGTTLLAGAGAPMAGILELSLEAGLSGLEMTAGLPGTAGGAAMGNAGSAGRGLAELIEGLELLDPGGRRLVLARKDLSPLHRTLNLPPELEGSIVIGLRLSLARSDPALARGEARRLLAARRAGQPTGLSLGCVFRNPPSESAGRLIDLCGLKGEIEGGAEVSRRHANFIMNTGRARSAEVLTLAARVRGAVEARFGLRLVPEIKILGQDGREAGLPMTGAEEAPAA